MSLEEFLALSAEERDTLLQGVIPPEYIRVDTTGEELFAFYNKPPLPSWLYPMMDRIRFTERKAA